MGKRKIGFRQEALAEGVPQSRGEVVEAVAEIGRRQRERERIRATMNDELAEIRRRYEEEAGVHGERIGELSKGVQVWCEAHRGELTQEGRVKTVNLGSGQVRWRWRPPKVVVRGAEAVLETLKRVGLERFIRVKEELNKEAVLADPEAVLGVKGISVSQGEDFVILPFETELEEVA